MNASCTLGARIRAGDVPDLIAQAQNSPPQCFWGIYNAEIPPNCIEIVIVSKAEKRIEIDTAMKAAMRAKEKERLATIRLMLAEIKRIEVDERIELDDARILAVLDKMLKQRRDSIEQFEKAGRDELAAQERSEMEVIQGFMPAQLDAAEIEQLIAEAITSTGAESMRDMGKVMAVLKPQLQGRADMGAVSAAIKAKLG